MSAINVLCVDVTSDNLVRLQESYTSGNYDAIRELASLQCTMDPNLTVDDVLAKLHTSNPLSPQTEAQQGAEAEQHQKKLNLFVYRAAKTEKPLLLLPEKTALCALVQDEFLCFPGSTEDTVSVVLLYSHDADLGDDGSAFCFGMGCCAAYCAAYLICCFCC
ncbi:hypothetical protein AGDE_12566 [Angomonas deanei]|uniref:Uncharacterized protein n=1 Tax=Angomonas deanei TaxID=59799 RepID=A0A7G2CG99_9TRYP|nr:hypothetical protein AGDE_12566 [Angomonas deanei]CAD2217212.1 hypothetical protein ADEAN_000469000 [Angomonas deanei]|eukprot:EPY24026.1 hypothetical protein AGDE_12566 [Angomonas deanei]